MDGYVGNLTPQQSDALKAVASSLNVRLTESGIDQGALIWGVPISALLAPGVNAGEEAALPESIAAQAVLLKFLRARSWNVAAALDQLVNCLKWRKEFKVDALEAESFPEQLEACGALHGRDKVGCPITYNFYGGIDVPALMGTPEDVERFVRWRVRLMERAIAQCNLKAGVEHILQVHDYTGANMFKMAPGMKQASRTIIKLFQDNYPEWLSSKLFLFVPKVMEFVFGIMTAFADANTRKKMCMVGAANSRAKLLEHVDWAQLPARYGGLAGSSQEGEVGVSKEESESTVAVRAGNPHTVTVHVVQAPATLRWQFLVSRGQVSATGSFVAEGGATQQVEAQTEAFGGGSLEVTSPGRFTYTLSNTGSGYLWVDDAQVLVSVRVSPPQPAPK